MVTKKKLNYKHFVPCI